MRLLNTRLLGALLLACAVAACDDEATPITPTPDPVTEAFTGAVAQNGASTHDFTTATGGAVTATLRSIGEDNTLVIGFSLGTWNATSGTCSIVLANDAATGGAVLAGTMSGAGTLCLRLYDVGNIPAGGRATYTVEVTHP